MICWQAGLRMVNWTFFSLYLVIFKSPFTCSFQASWLHSHLPNSYLGSASNNSSVRPSPTFLLGRNLSFLWTLRISSSLLTALFSWHSCLILQDQRMANFVYKGLESKYFMLCSHTYPSKLLNSTIVGRKQLYATNECGCISIKLYLQTGDDLAYRS